MSLTGLIFLLAAHYFTGKGLLKLFKIETGRTETICLSFITGVPILSFGPCLLQLLHTPIVFTSTLIITAIIAAPFSIPLLVKLKKPALPKITIPQPYEWASLAICFLLVLFSIWRCF